MSRRRRAALLGYAAGLSLLAAGSTGSAALYVGLLGSLAAGLGEAGRIVLLFAVLLAVLAGFGGLTVGAGAWLIDRGSARVGAFLVQIGAGAGIFGLLFNLAVLAVHPADVRPYLAGSFASLGGLGVLLAVASATVANPVPLRRWWRRARRALRSRGR